MPSIEDFIMDGVKTLEEAGLVLLERHEDGVCIVADKKDGRLYAYQLGWCLDDPQGMPIILDLV
jgi:hypothetical protein